MMRRRICVITALMLCVCLGAGCGKSEEQDTKSAKEVAEETEESDGPRVIKGNDSDVEGDGDTAPKRDILVAIDPGHQSFEIDMSGLEPNAPGSSVMKAKATGGTTGKYSGIPEYQLNMDISLMLREELENRGYDVLLTRENNETAISNSQRAILANESGADISVRIHANGSDDSGIGGALAIVPSEANAYAGQLNGESMRLAQSVLNRYCEASGMANQGVQTNDTMTGINWSEIPVMILEMGYMSNEQDDLNMADGSFRMKMVTGIADGIDDYYGFSESENVSEELTGLIREVVAEGEEAGESWQVYSKRLGDKVIASSGEGKMESASLVKLFTAVCVYENMDAVKSQESSDGETRKLLFDMISASDNEAANTLVTRLGNGDASVGMNVVNSYCADNGYEDTHMGRLMLDFDASDDNYTSARDCGKLLEKLYLKEAAGSEEIAEAMKQQERKGKIPAGIAENVECANKTGELDDVENDAAIVYAGDSVYILCVTSGNLADTKAARERIQKVSGIVYDYMTR